MRMKLGDVRTVPRIFNPDPSFIRNIDRISLRLGRKIGEGISSQIFYAIDAGFFVQVQLLFC